MTERPLRFVSVKFSTMGRVQTVSDTTSEAQTPAPGQHVVVRSDAGLALGTVVGRSEAVASRHAASAAGHHLVRVASAGDVQAREMQDQREREAFQLATMKIRERGLGMKLSRVEHSFDGARLVFFFTADARVDFRELVRELAAEFRARIEMRQIGVRDEARLMGGYGTCGRPLCCTTWLNSFEPVSIKMARQQDLSLNPSKLSGLCGRLKCCLRYELPNAKGVVHGGCGSEGGCDNPTGCGSGGCGTGGCGSGGCGCHA